MVLRSSWRARYVFGRRVQRLVRVVDLRMVMLV